MADKESPFLEPYRATNPLQATEGFLHPLSSSLESLGKRRRSDIAFCLEDREILVQADYLRLR